MKTKLRPGWVLALLCTVLFFYGFYLGGVQLVISEVSREYGQNAAGMGGLVAAQHVAAVVLPVVLGALADRIGKKPVLCIFAAVFAVGCFLAGLSKNLGVYVIARFASARATACAKAYRPPFYPSWTRRRARAISICHRRCSRSAR